MKTIPQEKEILKARTSARSELARIEESIGLVKTRLAAAAAAVRDAQLDASTCKRMFPGSYQRQPIYQIATKRMGERQPLVLALQGELDELEKSAEGVRTRLSALKIDDKTLILLITAFDTATQEIGDLEALEADKRAELAKLATAVDLHSDEEMTRAARVQTLIGLLPARLNGKRADLVRAEAELLESAHQFYRCQLRPKQAQLLDRAKGKVRAAIEGQFAGPTLEQVVQESELVRGVEHLCSDVKFDERPMEGVRSYALALVGNLETLRELEPTLNAESSPALQNA